MFIRRPHQVLGAQDVVGHGRQRMLFHQRHMLEGGGVEDQLRRMGGENLIQHRTVGHVAQDGGHGAGRAGFCPFPLKMVELALRALQQQQPGRPQRGQAQSQGGADGAARAGDEGGLPAQSVEGFR